MNSFCKLFISIAFVVLGFASHSSWAFQVDAPDDTVEEYIPEGISKRRYNRLCKRWKTPERYQTEAALQGKEPRSVCKIPPKYSEICMRKAKSKEVIRLKFDIMPTGGVENVRLVSVTRNCLAKAAIKATYLWQYETSEDGAKDIVEELTLILQW